MDLENLPDIQGMWRDHMQSQIKPRVTRARLWASDIGHPCARYQFYQLTAGDQAAAHNWRLQGIFNEGNIHEPAVRRTLEDMGFEIAESGTPVEHNNPPIGAKLDLLIRWKGKKFPAEVKSCSPHVWEKLHAAEDVLHNPQQYIRRWGVQLQIYLLGRSAEVGCLLLKNKLTGELKPIWMQIDIDFLDPIIKRAELAYKAKASGVAPDRIQNLEYCEECPFAKTICLPSLEREGGVQIIQDQELEEMLRRRDEIKATRDEYEEIDERLKDSFKARGVSETICGDHIVSVKEQSRKTKVPITFTEQVTTFFVTKIARMK